VPGAIALALARSAEALGRVWNEVRNNLGLPTAGKPVLLPSKCHQGGHGGSGGGGGGSCSATELPEVASRCVARLVGPLNHLQLPSEIEDVLPPRLVSTHYSRPSTPLLSSNSCRGHIVEASHPSFPPMLGV